MVLCYHGVRKRFEPGISSVSTGELTRQLDYLLALGWSPGNTDRVLQDDRTLAVTLDDAFESQVLLLGPLLAERRLRSTLFVPAGWVGERATWDYFGNHRLHASWSQLGEWCHLGHAIGSHGMWHRDLRTLSNVELDREVSGSRMLLEDRLGVPVKELSYPFGRNNERIRQRVEEAGYLRAFTTKPKAGQGGLFAWPRIVASCLDTPFSLAHRAEEGAWAHVERGKQQIISYWAGGTAHAFGASGLRIPGFAQKAASIT